jgi:hypothetical protein
MKPLTLCLIFIGVLIVGAAVIVPIVVLHTDATLEFQVRDTVSRRWVWGTTMLIQDREMHGFYQSDAGLLTYRFTHLIPEASTLVIGALGYQEVDLPVTLHRGVNRLGKPIDMVGIEIPDLTRFVLFESLDKGDIVAELRPVGPDNKAILNHPCMDLWIGCRIFVEMAGGVTASAPVDEGYARGAELYRGPILWTWDPAPETVFRYKVRIPNGAVRADPSPLRVIDYLIAIPDPRKISKTELSSLMERALNVTDPAARAASLDGERDRLKYYTDTSGNVKARQE